HNTDFWINLGYIYEAEGKAQEAIKCYRQVTLIDVNDYEAWISLNSLLMRMKEFELALVYLREAFIQFPGDDRLRIRLAECHFRRGTESIGIKYLKAALISNSSVIEEFEKSYKKILWSPAIHELVGKYVS
ncbi:MAG TPA: tetratricopeptide repeat protein, partial [Bacteroidales bacterium]|nr:tetratricopeptide repeat protein [Bacteroidales bacterium]